MKSARCAGAFCVVLAAAISLSQADDATRIPLNNSGIPLQPPPDLTPPPATQDDSNDMDPETAGANSMAGHDAVVQQEAMENMQAAQKQQAYDNDWMLREYTAGLRQQGLAAAIDPNSPTDQSGGVTPVANPTAFLAPIDPLLPPLDNQPKSPDRRDTSSDNDATTRPSTSAFLQPLLPPMTRSGDPVTRLDAWGSTTVTDDTTQNTTAPNFITPGIHDLRPDANGGNSESSLDVPGLTAERQTLGDSGDLNLPDQQMETATENADNRARRDFLVPTVPVANSESDFFKKQAEALAPTMSPTARLASMSPNGNIPLGPPRAPDAPMKAPVTVGIRSHVVDPFDLIGGHRDPDADRTGY